MGIRIAMGFVLGLSLAFATAATAAPQTNTLIVISIDGFRADYFDRGLSPNLKTLAETGVHAKAMRPSYPSVTEPNHYTLMTGLYPDHHGIIDNVMIDAKMPGEVFGQPPYTFDSDPRWWNEATPLWVSAAKTGIRTASSGWPGADGQIHGVRPDYLEPWNDHLVPGEQAQVVLNWLDLPAAQRPGLILLHFDPVDEMGHQHGPDSKQVNAAIGQVDAALGDLIAGLRKRGLYDSTNLVILSDHGMTATGPKRVIWLDDLFPAKDAVIPSFGAYAGVDPLPGHEAEIEKAMLKPHAHMTCWKKAEIPARLHYGTNPRVPEIWCMADDGWLVITRAIAAAYGNKPLWGDHGYDITDPKMGALFVAEGPAFKQDEKIAEFPNVDVYPMLTKLLGITAQPNDGDGTLLKAALR